MSKMFNRYRESLNTALSKRKKTKLPRLVLPIVAVLFFSAVYLCFAVLAVPSSEPITFNFREGGIVMALSAIFLSMGCAFAVGANIINLRATGKHQWLWIIAALALAFLAFDELVEFHERVGHQVFQRILPQDTFRSWNDVIVIMYGVIALPVAALLLPHLLRYKLVIELFVFAFLFYVSHTLIDSTQEPETALSKILEESSKVFSTAFLMLGTLAGFVGNAWETVESNE